MRSLPPVARLVGTAVLLVALTGCTTLHSWVQLGSNHPAQAGASMSVPFGK